MGTGEGGARRQYEGTWLGLPLKHVALVTVCIPGSIIVSGDAD